MTPDQQAVLENLNNLLVDVNSEPLTAQEWEE
jgi:hypothetical protein